MPLTVSPFHMQSRPVCCSAHVPVVATPPNQEAHKASDSGGFTERVSKKARIDQHSFDPTMVQVKVGPGKTPTVFMMHKSMLCNVAPYFKAILNGSVVKTKTEVLTLKDEDVSVFRHFNMWVYTERILAKGEAEKDIPWKSLAGLYIFGLACGIPDLQNATIDILIEKKFITNVIPTMIIPQIYKNTLEGSPLRRLVVDWMACGAVLIPNNLSMDWFKTRENFPQEFLIDLVYAQYAMRAGTQRLIKDFRTVRGDYYVKSPVAIPEASDSVSVKMEQR